MVVVVIICSAVVVVTTGGVGASDDGGVGGVGLTFGGLCDRRTGIHVGSAKVVARIYFRWIPAVKAVVVQQKLISGHGVNIQLVVVLIFW